MSILAWDGKIIAADKRAVNGDLYITTTKLFKVLDFGMVIGGYAGFVGDAGQGMALLKWLADGAEPIEYPAFQATENWTRLIHIDDIYSPIIVKEYQQTAYPLIHEERYLAWGSGRDYALAAMYLGKSAIEAVKFCSNFDPNCGNGVTHFEPLSKEIIRHDI